ncbi:hypothetical protein BKA62DRAFT_672845 [Auriculariales sp. MPI-PUGE-AT-0066]|nr:hypothetical protein BKA62DRAFT_672845 [Auriculariales sp. MPI-PUGE-AT-0066]
MPTQSFTTLRIRGGTGQASGEESFERVPEWTRERHFTLAHRPLSSKRITLVVPKVHDVTILNSLAEAQELQALWNVGSIAVWKPKTQDSGLRVMACWSVTGSNSNSLLTYLRVVWVAEDYCADARVHGRRRARNSYTHASHLVTAARAHGLHAIDMASRSLVLLPVCVDYKDAGRLLQESQSARRLGFSGKQAIHPSQVETIQRVFLPTPEGGRAEHSCCDRRRDEDRGARQRGAFGLTLPGTQSQVMIDAPMLKQAENILEVARAAGLEIPRLK